MLPVPEAGFLVFASDYIIIFAVFALVAWLSMMRGVGYATGAALALPVTLFLHDLGTNAFGVADIFASAAENSTMALIIFAGLFAILTVLISSVIDSIGGDSAGPLQALFAGLGFSAMLLATWQQFAPFESVWMFQENVTMVFATPYYFWWTFGSLGLLYFAARD